MKIPQNIQRYTRKDLPVEVKLNAARGLVPLPIDEQVILLGLLLLDENPEIKKRAAETLKELPAASVKNVLSQDLPGEILDSMASAFGKNAEFLELIAMNKNTLTETLLNLIKLGIPSVLEVISLNQVRLIKENDILNALLESPTLGRAAQDRLQEFFLRHLSRRYLPVEKQPGVKKPEGLQGEKRVEVKDNGKEIVELPQHKADLPDQIAGMPVDSEMGLPVEKGDSPSYLGSSPESAGLEGPRRLDSMEIPAEIPEAFFELPKELTLDTEKEMEPEEKESLLQRLSKMNAAEKIKLALFGNKEVRSNLIRDANKMVATSVLKSPKLVDTEIAMYAQSRNVCDEVIRGIAANKEWVKNYRVKVALVNNPKTPLPIAMRMVNFLNARDLRDLANSKNVSSAISSLAKSHLQQRMK